MKGMQTLQFADGNGLPIVANSVSCINVSLSQYGDDPTYIDLRERLGMNTYCEENSLDYSCGESCIMS